MWQEIDQIREIFALQDRRRIILLFQGYELVDMYKGN